MKKKIVATLIMSIILLVGCHIGPVQHHYYLHLMGESDNWNVKDYEIEFNPENYRAGNGIVVWKGKDPLETDSFHIRANAMINGEEQSLQGTSISGDSIINEQATGSIEGGTFLNDQGHPITLEDIEEIYIVIEWWDNDQEEHVSERINLYRTKDD